MSPYLIVLLLGDQPRKPKLGRHCHFWRIIVVCNYLFLFALTELTSGKLHSPINYQSILVQPHHKHSASVLTSGYHQVLVTTECLWWSCGVPPPGPA